MSTKDQLPHGFDDETSPFYVPEAARKSYAADRASLEGAYDLDALASAEASFEFSLDHAATGSSSLQSSAPAMNPTRAPGRDALIARALHRRAVQMSNSRVQS